MTCGIYEIKNKEEGTVYIGQSITIEKRWKAHLNINDLNTCSNLRSTLELYHENHDLVDFNIVIKIPEELYNKEELPFMLSVHEKHELELRGGHKSPEVINQMPISIPAVPPTILLTTIPDFVTHDDIIKGITKWAEKERNKEIFGHESFQINWGSTENSYNSKLHPLENRICELEDMNEDLTNQVSFWKNKAAYWRNSNGK